MATADTVKDKLARQNTEAPATTDGTAAEKPKTIRQLLEDPSMQAELAKALPNTLTPQRLTRLALTAINSQPNLQMCSATSLLAATMQCAALGLEPNTPLQHCWLLPFQNRGRDGAASTWDVTFILGYRGIIDLALRGGRVLSIEAREVRENDEFEYAYGVNDVLRHKPALKDRGEIICYYGIARFPNGGYYWRLVDPDTIEEHRQMSKSANSPAWRNNHLPMALKTVVRIMAPYIPLSAQAAEAISADDTSPVWDDMKNRRYDEDGFIDTTERSGEPQHIPADPPSDCPECGKTGEHMEQCSLGPF